MQNVAKEVAKLLIKYKCVQLSPLEPFIYASGLKGPIYCDNRKLLSFVDARNYVIDSFVELIQEKAFTYDLIAGMATAGIAHAALVADRLNCPMVYVRSKAKEHGKQNQIEGAYFENQELILIEDLVNQGKSLGEGIDGVRNAGLKVSQCLSIVDYEMNNSKNLLQSKGVKLFSLTTFTDLANTALELGDIDQNSYDLLIAWQKDPQKWSVMT